ncbi:putative endoplasmic reticulum calcium ATPase [Sesbania bispinosa]|nr:putative endoplasmic reticulum calcium ATPase [Sesbania bispinosa]
MRSMNSLTNNTRKREMLRDPPFLRRTISKWIHEIVSLLLPIILKNGEDLRCHLLVVNLTVEILPHLQQSPSHFVPDIHLALPASRAPPTGGTWPSKRQR